MVLAAGALNSAAILLRSAGDGHPNGLANSSGLVGRNYMCHQNSTFVAINIRVNCVVPGPVLRPAGEPEAVLDAIAQGLTLKRIGHPQDIAQACVFLARNDFATGAIVRVDGGEGLARRET